MKTKIFKEFSFSAAHHLKVKEHPCSVMHGHNYRVRIELSGELDRNGMIMDFGEIKERMSSVINKLDHSFLNDIIILPTTSENIAAWILKQANDQIGCVTRVTLWETDSCGAIVEV